MTLENVGDVRAAVVNTTDGVPGSRTFQTYRRFTADSNLSRGYGRVNAVRAVGRLETTSVDPTVAYGAGVGGAAALAFAPAASTESPSEAFQAIVDRFQGE